MRSPAKLSPDSLSNSELRHIIETHLPAWLKACSADADAIILHEEAFGTSDGELFLFGCAIKYATGAGKTVHIACKRSSDADRGAAQQRAAVIEVFREDMRTRRAAGRKKQAKG